MLFVRTGYGCERQILSSLRSDTDERHRGVHDHHSGSANRKHDSGVRDASTGRHPRVHALRTRDRRRREVLPAVRSDAGDDDGPRRNRVGAGATRNAGRGGSDAVETANRARVTVTRAGRAGRQRSDRRSRGAEKRSSHGTGREIADRRVAGRQRLR